MQNKKAQSINIRQYLLTGAGLGLYFGWFFRPVREPSLWVVFGLSIVVTIVMTLLRLWRGEREQLLKRAAITMIKYIFVLSILEGRHLAFDAGGRVAVVAMTVIMGAFGGYWMARQEQAVSVK